MLGYLTKWKHYGVRRASADFALCALFLKRLLDQGYKFLPDFAVFFFPLLLDRRQLESILVLGRFSGTPAKFSVYYHFIDSKTTGMLRKVIMWISFTSKYRFLPIPENVKWIVRIFQNRVGKLEQFW